MKKPICFLDVDGVINTVKRNELTEHTLTCEGYVIHMPKGTRERIEKLSEHFDMVWLTTWEHLANKHYTPFWEFDEWPVVEWRKVHRNKLIGMHYWFAENEHRPWVWIDDDGDFWRDDTDIELVEGLPRPNKIIAPYIYDALGDAEVKEAIDFAQAL